MACDQEANEDKKQPSGGGSVPATREAAHHQDGQDAADDQQPANCVGNFSFVHSPPGAARYVVDGLCRKPIYPKARAM